MKNRKYLLLPLLAALCLLLTACASEPAEPEYKVTGNPGRMGVKYGDTVIADPIWDSIRIIRHSQGVSFAVCMNDKYGLMDHNGNLIVEPTEWTFVWTGTEAITVEDNIFVDIRVEGDKSTYGTHIVNAITGKEVYYLNGDPMYIIGGRYMPFSSVEYSYGKEPRYGLFDAVTLKVLATDVPVYDERYFTCYDGLGIHVTNFTSYNTFFFLNGQKVSTPKSNKDLYVDPQLRTVFVEDASTARFKAYDANGKSLLPAGYLVDWRQISGKTVNLQHDEDGTRCIAFLGTTGGSFGLYHFGTNTFTQLPGVSAYENFSDGMARVQNKDGLWGYINAKGEFVYDFQFQKAEDFQNGTASVVLNYRNRTVDKNGNIN